VKVTCGKCQTSYSVAEERVPLSGARTSCPNCGGTILIPGVGTPAPAPSSAFAEKDFSKTMSVDFSQVVQEEDDAARLLAEAEGSPAVLHPGVAYALVDQLTRESHPVPSADFVIGRTGADLSLADPEISRRHCRVKVMGDHLVLIDLDSTNGTRVRGEKVKTARITPGQAFSVGNTTLEFTAARKG